MIHQTVEFKFTEDAKDVKLVGFVESVENSNFIVRLADDSTTPISMSSIYSTKVVCEEHHHEFVNDFLRLRKERLMIDLTDTVMSTFDSIIHDNPTDSTTLLTELINSVKRSIEIRVEDASFSYYE